MWWCWRFPQQNIGEVFIVFVQQVLLKETNRIHRFTGHSLEMSEFIPFLKNSTVFFLFFHVFYINLFYATNLTIRRIFRFTKTGLFIVERVFIWQLETQLFVSSYIWLAYIFELQHGGGISEWKTKCWPIRTQERWCLIARHTICRYDICRWLFN